MTEADRTGRDGGVPGQNPQEILVTRNYIGNLVEDYISHEKHSSVLVELFRNGLPNEARLKQSESKINIRQDLRDVLLTILETYGFWKEIPRKKPLSNRTPLQPFYPYQGLPHLGLIVLQHTLSNDENPTIRFKKNEDGNIVAKGVDSGDFGARGFPPGFFMASEYLVVNFDGKVKLGAKYFPGKDKNGTERQYFKSHPLFPNSLLVLKSLVTIALNGAKLQEKGQLFYANRISDNSRHRLENRPKIFT